MGKAAVELAMSQPSVSKAIADLECAVGLPLLDRSATGVEATIYGQALLECGVAVFDDLRQGVRALEFLADPNAGELRIGCTEPLAAGFVSAIIERLSQRYPRVVFRVVPADSETLKDRELRQRNIELAVGLMSESDENRELDTEFLLDDRHAVMADARSKWARRRGVQLADLINELWILPPPDSIMGPQIAAGFRACGLEPPRAQVISFSLPLHHHLLAAGQFITLLPMSVVYFAKHMLLKALPVEAPKIPRPTGIIRLKNRTSSPLAEIFINCAREVAKPLAKRRQPISRVG
jgi:DNA-binding transcriptional LysR family regulator